ncbi:hypothetical protein WI80_00505 [Burkholderia ubonensis]|uniref:response regulator transcription factor n=1 Tax=Burkholderia ubonensis TaxID=101571 RepID=UPI000754D338|nr:response regulator transcription factor [Burkholderia ubonensis]KVD16116.1 hypothetical protein WI80_00505 [Burkholderia ubonensis]KVU24984.1 hypothetical protein WK63_25795 [Burkholderia ubonensis]
MHILIITGDILQAGAIGQFLRHLNYRVSCVADPKNAMSIIEQGEADLLLLDWESSKARGSELIEAIRSRSIKPLPVLCLANQASEIDLASMLRGMNDDYVLKPFSGFELAERIDARLKAKCVGSVESGHVCAGKFVMNFNRRSVLLRGEEVRLTAKEYDLLAFLFRNVGKVVSRQLIWMAAWGRPMSGVSRTLDTHIYRLRKKLDLSPRNGVRLSSVYTHGYRFDIVNCDDATDAHHVQTLASLPGAVEMVPELRVAR